VDRVLAYVCFGSRGGPTRVRILKALLREPRNTNRLAEALGLDYKTVEYNLRVLAKHRLVVRPLGDAYGTPWEPSKNLLADLADFLHAAAKAAEPADDLGKRRYTHEEDR
jgi:DNA-binding transcriptional ArsR family regulator